MPDKFHLCVTCGRLKHERMFESGDDTCRDCYREVKEGYRKLDMKFKEDPDGDGFIYVEAEA